jgi:hypothetical protein
MTPNPSLRSYIIHHLGKLGTDANLLADQLLLGHPLAVADRKAVTEPWQSACD